MLTNQEIYAKTGIQVSDIQAIAAKFGYDGPYSQEQVDLMMQMKAEAGKKGQTIKKFLATIEVGGPVSPASSPDPAIDTDPTEQFQSSIASAAQGLTVTAVDLYSTLDAHLTTQEEAFSSAVLSRFMASPVNCMTLVAEGLAAQSPSFFRLAPEGAALPVFAIPGTSDDKQEAIGPAVDTNASIIQ